MHLLAVIKEFFYKHRAKIIWGFAICYLIFIFLLLISKYQSFGYNALDLGIYNQVFYNTSQGNLFAMSIHPHSYLGDHFELFILILIPFYKIFSSPLALLFLQTFFIVLATWPLYLIAKQKLNSFWSFIIIILFLFNPLILNLQFFEFHILPFSIFLLLFSFYFYYKDRFIPFLIFIFLSLLVREDVALVIIMFGILAWWEKKDLKWILTPILIGINWFLSAMQLTGYFSQYGNYKFLSMYGWLGNSISEIFINIITKPWIVLKQVLSLNNLLSFVGIFLPLALLPLLKPKYLIPSLLIGVQILLLSGSSSIIIKTHYTSLLIPFIFIALIFSMAHFLQMSSSKNKILSFLIEQKTLFFIILFTSFVYSIITISPIIPTINNQINIDEQSIKITNNHINRVGLNDNVLSSYKYLPNLSSRTNIFSLHYSFFGKKQFSNIDFDINVPIDKAIIDFDDFTTYYLQSKYSEGKIELYPSGADRIRNILDDNNLKLSSVTDTQAIYEKNVSTQIHLVEPNVTPKIYNINEKINNNLTLLAIEKTDNKQDVLPLKFYWEVNGIIEDNYFIQLILTDQKNNIVYQKIYPIGYGLYPTSSWLKNTSTNYWFTVPEKYSLNEYNISFQITNIIYGRLNLDGIRSASISISNAEKIGPEINIDYNNL